MRLSNLILNIFFKAEYTCSTNNVIFLFRVCVTLKEFMLDFTQHHLFSFYDRTQRETILLRFDIIY